MSSEQSTNSSYSNVSSDYQSPKNDIPSKSNNSLLPSNPEVIYAEILQYILFRNKSSNNYYEKIVLNKDGHFTYKLIPPISLLNYLRRIIKFLNLEFSTLIISMIYIDRICKEKVYLNEFNIHRIMIIAIYVAYIYNEDCIHDNNYLALVSGIKKEEMVLLENEFLELIEFKLFVSNETYDEYKQYFNEKLSNLYNN